MAAAPAGRPALRPRHRRQQGTALDQFRRARRGAEDPRPARLQRRIPGRDRRGGRLARPARDLPALQGPARRRRADRLGRAAPRAGAADDLSRRARRDEFRSASSSCARAAIIPAIGAGCSPIPASSWRMRWRRSPRRQGAIKVREWVPSHLPNSVRVALADCSDRGRRGRARDRPGLGRAGPVRRARRCSAGAVSRCSPSPPATPRTRSTRSRRKPTRPARSALSSASIPRSSCRRCAAISTRTAFRWSGSSAWKKAYFPATRLDPDHPWVRWAAASIAATTGKRAGDPAQSRRLAAQRHLRRRSRPADDLGPAFLRRRARSTRPTSTCSPRSRARRWR